MDRAGVRNKRKATVKIRRNPSLRILPLIRKFYLRFLLFIFSDFFQNIISFFKKPSGVGSSSKKLETSNSSSLTAASADGESKNKDEQPSQPKQRSWAQVVNSNIVKQQVVFLKGFQNSSIF